MFIILIIHTYVIFSSYMKNDGYQEQSLLWDGVEIRLLRIIAEILNFTLDVHDATLLKAGYIHKLSLVVLYFQINSKNYEKP